LNSNIKKIAAENYRLSARERVLFEQVFITLAAIKFSEPWGRISDAPAQLVHDFKKSTKKFLRDSGRDRKTVDRHVHNAVRMAAAMNEQIVEPLDLTSTEADAAALKIVQRLHALNIDSIAELQRFID
jgi:hypothetical protein